MTAWLARWFGPEAVLGLLINDEAGDITTYANQAQQFAGETETYQRVLNDEAAHARTLKAVAIPGEANSLSAQEAARYALEQGFEAEPAESVAQALASILRTQAPKGPARILICGSLYLAGKVLAENEGD